MTFKRMFRFASAFLLLAVGSSAYTVAEAQEVTLKDGKTKLSWAAFANAVNNPSQIKGSASQEAIDALDGAKANLKAAQNVAKTKADDLTAAKNALQVKEDSLTMWQNQISTYSGLLSGYNSKLTTYQAELATLNTQLSTYSSDLTEEEKNYTMELPASLKKIIANAREFSTLYSAGETGGKVFYKKSASGFGGKSVTLTLAFTEAAPETTGWTETNTIGLYEYLGIDTESVMKVNKLEVYLGSDYNAVMGSNVCTVSSYQGVTEYVVQLAVNEITNLNLQESLKTKTYKNPSEIERLKGLINDLKTEKIPAANNLISSVTGNVNKVNNLIEATTAKINAYIAPVAPKTTSVQNEMKADVQAKQALKDEADAVVAEKQKAVDDAQTAHDKSIADSAAAALDNYKTVQLNADITVAAADLVGNFDGVIIGNGHVITLGESAASVFNNFSGTLSNVAVNGKFAASVAGAKFSNVAAWNSVGAYYNEAGAKTDNIGTLSQLGYLVRDNFKADVANNKIVAMSTEGVSPVYKLTVYNINSTPIVYVQESNGALLKDGAAYDIPANTFAKSETRDLKGVANIFFDDNTCESVVISDKNDFYCPVDLVAAKVSYNRNFAAGKQAVCLPFELTASTFGSDNVEYICRYDKEDEARFWFKKIGGAIPAYTPTLIHAKGAFTMAYITNVTIKATPASQITEDEGDVTDPSKGYGMLKKATRDEFNGVEYGYSIFGLTTSGTFKRAADGVALPALRLVVSSKYGPNTVNGGPAKSLGTDEKGIGILEEDGTTAIEDVAANVAAVTVVGGQNEIIFTAEADYTKVGVYSIDGRLAATADIKAGTTSVNVPTGLYVVMGKKVLVK